MAVYRGFDRETLEREYYIRGTVPDAEFAAIIGRYASDSAEARATLFCVENVSYGPTSDEVMDIFPAKSGAPALIWVHGGYWRMLSHKESSSMAGAFTRRGAATVAVNYGLAPATSLDAIVAQCRRAVAWLYRNGPAYGIDPERLYVAGSSAGGHLVGMLIAGGWQNEFGVPENVVKGCCALSGLYDLEPLLHCAPNAWLSLDAAAARRNSPIHHIPDSGGCPLIVSYGGNETGEFKRQTDDFAAAWRTHGFPAAAVDMAQCNHFDIVLELGNPEGPLTRAVFAMMEL